MSTLLVSSASARAGGRLSASAGCLVVTCALGAAGLIGCAQPTSARRDPVTLRIGVAAPKAADPGGGVQSFIGNLVSETLIGVGWDGRPVGRILYDPDWQDDGLTLQLRLSKDVRFHDGTPVDAPFIKASLERLFKGNGVSFRSVTGVHIVDRDLLKISLSRPEALLLAELSIPWVSHPSNADIGLGPYRIVERTPRVRLAAFDGYYRGRPQIDFVEVHDYDEQRSSWAALMRGDIDAVHEISPGAIDFVQAEGQTNVRTYQFTKPYYIQLVYNMRHPVLKNQLVRQALSYAVDRQAIINLGLNQQGVIAEGPIWPSHWAYSTAQKTYTHNPEAATLRLDAAGYRVKKDVTVGRMPSRFRFRCLTIAKVERYEKIALILQKQLYEAGIDMEIETVPLAQLPERIAKGAFDAILVERASGRSLAWTYTSFHSTTMPTGYTSADRILDRLRTTTADSQVRNAVSDLQQILHDDPPAIFIAWPKVARVVSTKIAVPEDERLKGRDVISSLSQWKVAEPGR